MDVGGKLLSALAAEGDLVNYRRLNLREEFFYGTEISLFKLVESHVAKYGALPKLDTLKSQFSDLPAAKEPLQYYADLVEQRYIHKQTNLALTECQTFMKDQDTFTTLNLLQSLLGRVREVQARTNIAEFTQDAHDLYMANYLKNKLSPDFEVRFGWPRLDKFGAARPGDVISFIGRPALGKTFSLLHGSMHGMIHQHTRNLFVSMEMPITEIMERQVAMYARYPMDHIQNYELSTNQQKNLPLVLAKAKEEEGRLWVMEGRLAVDVDAVYSLAQQLDVDAVWIDGAYLLGHPDKRMNKFQRTDANIEKIKTRTTDCGIPTFLSYQFNRAASQKQKKSKGKEKGDLEDIGLTDAIGQISSIVVGMFEEETVETLVARTLKVLKGRKGQIGEFRINWDFLKMDFSEIQDDEDLKKGKLQFT